MFTPVCLKDFGVIQLNDNDLRLPFGKILAQLRHVPLAG